jgi:CPA2 family monovalent cation:H+ antiporter-2
MNHSELFPQLLILIGSTTLVATFFHYLKIPTIIGFILAGILIGPYGLGLVNSVPGAESLIDIGVIFLMFTIGIEFSFRRLKRMKKPFFGLGMIQVIGTLLISSIIIKYAMGFEWSKAIFVGACISLSSTAIVLKLLQDARETSAPYGVTTIGILLCQDLAVIPIMLCLPLLVAVQSVSTPITWATVQFMILKLAGLLVLLVISARYIVPMIMERIIRTRSRELFFFAMLLLCFGSAFAMDKIGLSLSFGAFLAGLMIAESPYGQQATSDIVPLRDNFLGLFFASIGMLVDVRFLFMKFHWIMLFVVSLFIIKSGLVYVAGRVLRYPPSIALITGLMVFQVGEFSFILADYGVKSNVFTKSELQFFLSVSVITMMITPLIFQKAPKFVLSQGFKDMGLMAFRDMPKGIMKILVKDVEVESLPPRTVASEEKPQGAHTIVIGFGVAGQNLMGVLKALQIPYSIIEQNFEVVRRFQKAGESIFYGDATSSEILHNAGLESAKLVVIAVSGVEMTRAILNAVRQLRPDVEIVIRVQYSREVEELGETKNSDIVVAEYETTIEMIARSLTVYGIAAEEIHRFISETRQRLRGSTASMSDFLHSVDLPAWQALGSIRPMRVKEGSVFNQKSLAEINLRANTGATVIAVFREGIGTAVPDAEFVVRDGDILHLIGDSKSFAEVEKLVSGQVC